MNDKVMEQYRLLTCDCPWHRALRRYLFANHYWHYLTYHKRAAEKRATWKAWNGR